MKKALILMMILVLCMLICGCTITSGVFTGFSRQSSDTSISASYLSFNGSMTKRLSLKEDETLRFAYEGRDGLRAIVEQGSNELCDISDGCTFTVPAQGTYDFTVEGNAQDGAFSLSWEIE